MIPKYCPECGKQLNDVCSFCPECGCKIIQEEDITSEPVSTSEAALTSEPVSTSEAALTSEPVSTSEAALMSEPVSISESALMSEPISTSASVSEPIESIPISVPPPSEVKDDFSSFSSKMTDDSYNIHNQRAGHGLGIVIIMMIIAVIGYFVIEFLK